MTTRPTLLFISPRFLFPVDSGGKIRTTQILRGMKDGRFRIKLASPASAALVRAHQSDLQQVCDEFLWWPAPADGWMRKLARASYLLGRLPMPVRADLSGAAKAVVRGALKQGPAVAVFDFLHSAVLAPSPIAAPSVLFTHNVEAEIFLRHRDTTTHPVFKALWADQSRKMLAFERRTLSQFDVVVAVSERDARKFAADYALQDAFVIPTGVDTDHFRYVESSGANRIVFCGSMDWLANQDAIRLFMDDIWSDIVREVPDATLTIVGRAPPESLVREASRRGLPWQFTGFVDDVRDHVAGAAVSIIPLRIGGGTRLKVYESMAMGPAVVSTAIGVEGLPVTDGVHCRIADEPRQFAAAVTGLLKDKALQCRISMSARQFCEDSCGYRVAARAFEEACVKAMQKGAA